MTQFSVRDGHDGRIRNLMFDGDLIGEVSSRRQEGPRWTELRLYRTTAGAYVLEKVGMSVVVHGPDCPEIKGNPPRFQAAHPGADPSDGKWWICEVCGTRAIRNITTLVVETDRHWAIIAEDPAQIVDALYRRKAGARSMPRMSIDLLDQAGRTDPAVLDSFRNEYVG